MLLITNNTKLNFISLGLVFLHLTIIKHRPPRRFTDQLFARSNTLSSDTTQANLNGNSFSFHVYSGYLLRMSTYLPLKMSIFDEVGTQVTQ